METIQAIGTLQEKIWELKKAPVEGNLKGEKQSKSWLERDIILNVGLKESFIRFFILLFLPWPFLAINH
ncbi:MAG: hypothetical protein ACYCOO_04160 [Chitinophagaceae bacterium]